MRAAIFGGSFDPVHIEHVRLVKAAVEELGLDEVLVMPARVAPHKRNGARASGEHRFEMCKIAFSDVPQARACDFELNADGTSYSYLTCRRFAECYPRAERYFLVGADMLEDFFTWKNPDEILRSVTLAACGRGEKSPRALHERFYARFGCDFAEVRFTGEEISSCDIRVRLAFGKTPETLDQRVFDYIRRNALYSYPQILSALELETAERREHSFRVAQMACARAKSLHLSEEEVLLAAALHDCGKYVPRSSPLLGGFVAPEGVPAPVLHQYTGAYLAEHVFGIRDNDVLNAIRYHTSGREGMSALEKLIYLSDLLEEGRTFPGVETLRTLFWKDLDACMLRSLSEQIEYLQKSEKPIYSLTEQAYLSLLKG